MAKPSANNSDGKLGWLNQTSETPVQDEIKVDSESKVEYTNKRGGVRLRSLRDARLIYIGQATGKQYIWNKAGSVVEVEALDSEILLAKRHGGRQCCGNSKDGNKIFEIAT